MEPISIFWFRRDLRLDDNTGLFHALKGDLPVLPLFIFDKNILDDLYRKDARVEFIHKHLQEINSELKRKGSRLEVFHDTPEEAWKGLIKKYNIKSVYINNDYEPYARERDEQIKKLLQNNNIELQTFKDQVIFEKDEVMKKDGTPYNVFTPYSRSWRSALSKEDLKSYTSALKFDNFFKSNFENIPSLNKLGFEKTNIPFPSANVTDYTLKHYKEKRDFPAEQGTSRIGPHLRFGTVSIRKLFSQAQGKSDTYVNELIWREFYQMILWHYPDVVTENFNRKYDKVAWRNNADEFDKWCEGKTGYPIVDAGMRQLNSIGYMHNRVRMITASFLSKHLLIDWRWGEAYFADKLLDYELASNNGGWQWAAGTGVDAAPYFRVFNPELQEKKFDPDKAYIKKWVSEYNTKAYPKPMVDHKEARERAINTYKKALNT
ncbi:MAG: cryptochrome/photolyase family protein [Candidatus Cyclobacteriaceae bacterium M2_1C_046]